MRAPPTALRRTVIDPVWLPLGVAMALVLLAAAAVAGLAAPLTSRPDAQSHQNVLPPRPSGVLACLAGRPDLGVAIVAHTGLDDLVSPATVWQALPVTGRPMTVRWWYEPAGTIPDGDDDRREWLRLQWAIVDSWIDARKAARSGQLTAVGPGSQ